LTTPRIFQSFATYKPNVLVRLINANKNSVLCDLEDSIQDIENPDNNNRLKSQARKDLLRIIEGVSVKINVRINPVDSPHFREDIELLKQIRNKISSVFIPKISSSSEIDLFYKAYGEICNINPILETKIGIDNIDEILSSKYSCNFQFVFFGNYDFHLDLNHFPIREQHSEEYWDIVAPLISKIERKGLKYGNSAYSNIGDVYTNEFIVKNLKKKCKRNFALISLHNKQTKDFNNELKGVENCIGFTPKITLNSNLDNYIKHKQKGRSFAFVGNSIITPQEYLLTKKNGRN